MPSLMTRIREMVTAQAHHTLDAAENPDVMAQQMLRELTEDIHHAQRALVAAMAAQKNLERGRTQLLADASQWERKAECLLAAGDEVSARAAVERAVVARAHADEQLHPLETAGRGVARQREQLQQLKSEWDKARQRAAQISVNQAAAEALGRTTGGADHWTRAMERAQRLDQLSRRASRFECEVEAASELMNEHTRLERVVNATEMTAAVEHHMLALKARLAGGSAPAAK